MFKSLFNTAIRSLAKRKFYSILNILGLATSMAFAFLLWLYVQDQQAYDQHFANADRIYRVNADFDMNGKRDIYSNAPRPVGPTLKAEYPEVEAYARVRGMGGLQVHTAVMEVEEVRVESRDIYISDSTVFKIFDREFIAGNPDESLTDPNSIVLSESMAKKLFGTSEAFGKSLLLQGFNPRHLKVTGIVKDEKGKSHIPMDAFISWTTFPYAPEMTQWYGAHVYTYILLNETNNIQALDDKIPAFYEKHMKETFDRSNGKADLIFQPITQVYLDQEYVWEPNGHGSRTNVIALNIVIIFLIVFACINYVNLATARATERAAEVGIRKTLGSSQVVLVAQFLAESVLLSVFSGLFALVLCIGILPYFNSLADLTVTYAVLLSMSNVLMVLGLSVLVGLLAGLYPAFYLSSLQTLTVLKGKFTSSQAGELLRKMLVTSQYFIAAILIASILFVAEQTRFIKNKDIGFDKESIIAIQVPSDTIVSYHFDPYLNELRKSKHIGGVTNSYYSLDREANQFTPTLENEDGTTFQTGADLITVDANFVEAIGLKMVEGRNFSRESTADQQLSILINETAVKKFGWEENPLAGKYVGFPDAQGNVTKLNVIGVVNDFSLGASYQTINPLIIFLNNSGGTTAYVRANANESAQALEDIKTAWTKIFPGYELNYNFLDESLDALYKKEDKFLGLLTAFSVIIIFIASLGIIGLISFTAELKKKEIAIRKVLGSPGQSIIVLLSRKFAILLLLANAAALPATWFLMDLWLKNFAYHIELGPLPFIIAFAVSIFFTGLSLIYHTAHALSENPVNALNYE